MQSTTNYSLNIVEGTDIVNPLTQFNPNFTDIDTIMKANADASIDHATCIKTGTVHAITRTNTGANVFRFTATGDWNTGDTMTVDGTLVSVYVSDGTSPSNGCFVINTEVLATIQGTRVTLYVNSGDASTISCDDSSLSFAATNVQDAIEELDSTIKYNSADATYSFPTNAAAIVGNNDEYTFTEDGVASITYTFANSSYSQFGVQINGYNLFAANISSSGVNLAGVRQGFTLPVKKNDILKVTFYSTYGMDNISLRFFHK